MESARRIIEAELENGADSVMQALKDAGWHLTHGPTYSRWVDQDNEVFAVIGSVDDVSIVGKRLISQQSIRYMDHAGLKAVHDYLSMQYVKELVKVLGGNDARTD